MKKLKICNRYEKMTPEELEEALKDFQGLGDRVLEAVGKVAQILMQNCMTRQYLPKRQRKDTLISN
ncbi:MAG TPA: hypothetical protein GXX19_06330 [Syntrophomonadaceae bacterium]|nr:hypothetical protein [Syntrophomonadaceae bacterium]